MESVIFLVIISACAIIISPIITVAMVSRTNRRLDIFTRRSERLLDMLFKQANDPETYKEDLGIFFNTEERKQHKQEFTQAPVTRDKKSEQESKSTSKAPSLRRGRRSHPAGRAGRQSGGSSTPPARAPRRGWPDGLPGRSGTGKRLSGKTSLTKSESRFWFWESATSFVILSPTKTCKRLGIFRLVFLPDWCSFFSATA